MAGSGSGGNAGHRIEDATASAAATILRSMAPTTSTRARGRSFIAENSSAPTIRATHLAIAQAEQEFP